MANASPTHTVEPTTEEIRVRLGNLSRRDHRFLTDLVTLYTDPARSQVLALHRCGLVLIHRSARDGRLEFIRPTEVTGGPN